MKVPLATQLLDDPPNSLSPWAYSDHQAIALLEQFKTNDYTKASYLFAPLGEAGPMVIGGKKEPICFVPHQSPPFSLQFGYFEGLSSRWTQGPTPVQGTPARAGHLRTPWRAYSRTATRAQPLGTRSRSCQCNLDGKVGKNRAGREEGKIRSS